MDSSNEIRDKDLLVQMGKVSQNNFHVVLSTRCNKPNQHASVVAEVIVQFQALTKLDVWLPRAEKVRSGHNILIVLQVVAPFC
jgi:hypothetical protein